MIPPHIKVHQQAVFLVLPPIMTLKQTKPFHLFEMLFEGLIVREGEKREKEKKTLTKRRLRLFWS